MKRIICLLLLLNACTPALEEAGDEAVFSLDVGEALGGDNTAGYLRAEEPRVFSFPQDHGLHPGYRNEWWYLTGNLQNENGRRFGYQLTFFSTAIAPGSTSSSGWQSPRIWMAHAALSDITSGQHIALERFSRENPGLAGARLSPFRVWLENWSLSSNNDNAFPWQIELNDDSFSLDLQVSAAKEPVLQGIDGLSQKSPDPGNASYYYSLTRLNTSGSIRLNGESYDVSADNQSGWDWFSLQFNDGQELMYYQLRDTQGNAHPSSAGNLTDLDAQQQYIQPEDISLQ